MVKHNKLVRSGIPEYLQSKNIPFKIRKAGKSEYIEKLYQKLYEEARELAKDRTIEELADLLEVIEAIKKLRGWSSQDVEDIRLKKLSERGGFDQPIILVES